MKRKPITTHKHTGSLVYDYSARHYGRFLHLVVYDHGVYRFCADSGAYLGTMPRRVLARWIASGRALPLMGQHRQDVFARTAKTKGWQRRTRYSYIYHAYTPNSSDDMKFLNTVAQHVKCCLKTPHLAPQDYKEFVGISYARFEHLRTNPKAMPTRQELLLLSTWFRCAIEDLYTPANTNLQKAMEAVAVAGQRTMVGRALQQATPRLLVEHPYPLKPNRFRNG
jgi:hypothetical protein